jgi:hypothetical protein
VKNKTLIFWIAIAVIILGWAAALLFITPASQQALRTQAAFSEHVVTVLRAKYPARRFSLEQDGQILRAGSYRLPLDKLYEELETAHSKGPEVDKRINDHFEAIFNPKQRNLPALATPPWEEAAKTIVPRLVTPDYGRRMDLVRHDLVPGVQVAYTLGEDKGVVLLVTSDDMKVWKLEEPRLYERALANLAARSQKVTLIQPPAPEPGVQGKWVGVAVGDGSDAARILLPEVRRQVAAVVGEPFFVGFPHNAFLVAFSRDFNRGQLYSQQVRSDFAGRPPQIGVSPEIFTATVKDGPRPASAAEVAAMRSIRQAPPPPPPPARPGQQGQQGQQGRQQGPAR